MTRRPVTSSSIVSVGYDDATQQLEVEFANGGIYQYADVPASAHAALVAAQSIGKHFAKHIRPTFSHTQVGFYKKGPRG